jgi:hypothetical protein
MAKEKSVEEFDFERIAATITKEDSPVGIDAKKTHVMILLALERLEQRLDKIEHSLKGQGHIK